MGRSCTVCASPARRAIDAALGRGVPAREIARTHKVGERAVQRHKVAHLSRAMVAVSLERERGGAVSILDRLERLLARVEAVAGAAERDGATAQFLAAARELRSGLEFAARLTGELDERPSVSVNILASAEVQQLVAVLLAALGPYPEARIAAASALSVIDVEATA